MRLKTALQTRVTSLLLTVVVMLFVSHDLRAEDETSRLSSRDEDFVKRENSAGEATIKMGELGAAKAQSHYIRMFAATIVTEHTKLNTELKLVAAHKDLELQGTPGSDGCRKLETASGFEFDKLFLAELESCHQESVSKLEEAARNVRDPDLKRWVDNTLPMLREYQNRLRELGTSIVATTSPSSSSYPTPLGVRSGAGTPPPQARYFR